jgi:SAM-dependent methyltransferase
MSAFRRAIASCRLFNFNSVERDLWVKKQAAQVPLGSRVLDVGAGACNYRNLFSHCDYKTQDFGQLNPSDLRGRAGYGDIDYRCDATAIPVESATFDAIICTEVLEHVPEPIKVIQELARILKSGGKLILTAPLGSGLHQEPYHFYGGYTPYWYKKFLLEAGFVDVTIEANGGFFKHFSQEAIRFALLSSPFRFQGNAILRILWAPLWILLLPWFVVFCPLLCHMLDRGDLERGFTVGYHVLAIKKGPGS